jgi:hypothetical protein
MSLLKVAGTTAASGQLYVDSVFSTYLYTGNGSTQTITNGIDLAGKGGMVWGKVRDQVDNHVLMDSARGFNKNLASNLTNPQTTSTPAGISANSNGFSLTTSNGLNESGWNYVSWTFREAPKFFDVVTYTGTGSARTIAHNLGSVPGMVIVKRTDTSSDWQVYSNGLTSAAYSIQLNLIAAQSSTPTVWNSTAPTSSVFSVGTSADVNASGGTYVAYLYAHDTSSTGIIQCGSYTGSGGVDSINLGWEAQYVMLKPTNTTGGWIIIDTARGMSMTSEKDLYANTSGAESDPGGTPSSYVRPTATGFSVQPGYWGTGATVAYMAIRMPNKPPTTGTQVYNAIARTGTGAAGVKVTGAGFTPDMSMISLRAGSTGEHGFIGDRLRGTNVENYLHTSASSPEVGDVPGFIALLSLDMDGQSLANTNAYGTREYYNAASYTYIDWFFKRAPGFFDVVCFNSINSTNQRVSHNLGVAPEMCITHARSEAGQWRVYHNFTGLSYYTQLQSTSASNNFTNIWGATNPTSTDMGFNSANIFGSPNTATAVAYLFATLAGISKVGSYTGNGTGQTIACGFSGGARFVLIRRTDASGSWYTFDSARGLTSGSSPYLLLNSTAAEVTGNNGVYASSGGFTLDTTASTTTNINGASYIFLSVS